MKFLTKALIITLVISVVAILSSTEVFAQCAMCRATLENNVSNGEIGMAASLNVGILYLFAMPYLLIGTIAYLWYRKSKENANTRSYSFR